MAQADSTQALRPVEVDSVPDRILEIDEIFIVGNSKTRERIIMREISLNRGEKLYRSDILEQLEADRNRLVNLRLFLTVDIRLIDDRPAKANIMIRVTERWYIFPIPIFKLADRNFNEWWSNQGRDLKRVNYGLKFYHYNMRGRGERLRLIAQGGFTRRYELTYYMPYIDRQQKNGLTVGVSFNETKNMAIRSEDHRQVFFSSDRILQQVVTTDLNYSHRESFHNFHNFRLGYRGVNVTDTVLAANPNYLNAGRNRQRYLFFEYRFRRDFRNNVAYPLSGWLLEARALKSGLGLVKELDLYRVEVNYSRYLDLGKGFYFGGNIKGRMSNLSPPPYYNFSGLGYGSDQVRGFELNVIESQYFVLNRYTLKKRLFDTKAKLGFVPFKQFRNIPLAVYFKVYYDNAYAGNDFLYEGNTRLTNRYLFGYGAGFDIVSFYDFVWRIEYSMNSEMEHGLFLNFRADF